MSLGRYALQSLTHRHVFVTPKLERFATTKGVGPLHSHRAYFKGRWLTTDVVRSGKDHRHKIIFKGKELISGLPVEGTSTDYF
jgi:hypothetical protein